MVAVAKSGIHFSNPNEFAPYVLGAGNLSVTDSAGTARTSATTNFFTEMARRGFQDTTDWTGTVEKTLLTVSGPGLMFAFAGPTAGGAETHTVKFVVDGITYTVTPMGVGSGERVFLLAGYGHPSTYTTSNIWNNPEAEALDTDKATFADIPRATEQPSIPTWGSATRGIPMLKWERTLVLSMTVSAPITNSTATAYSGAMYRARLQS